MHITINGTDHVVTDGLHLEGLIRQLDLEPEGLAVLFNQQVVSRSHFASTALNEGDDIELVRMVGGG